MKITSLMLLGTLAMSGVAADASAGPRERAIRRAQYRAEQRSEQRYYGNGYGNGYGYGNAYGNAYTQVDAMIVRAYRDILRREPDPQGFANYRWHILNRGLTESGMRRAMLSSEEYQNRFGYGNRGYGQRRWR